MPLFLGVKGKCYVIIPNLKVIMAYAATVQVIHPSPTSSYPSPPLLSLPPHNLYTVWRGEGKTSNICCPTSYLLCHAGNADRALILLSCVTSYSTTVDALRIITNAKEKVKKYILD